ncbi:MAG: METTL5 family protein [Thermoplasmata archaeon]|nr:METTL5 family protein [Thermoplasmata archaeon]
MGRLAPYPDPKAELEQVVTPAELATELLGEADLRGDLEGRNVLDLGSGTGVLAIGAALLGALVRGVEIDPAAVAVARSNAMSQGVDVAFETREVDASGPTVHTVIMNPPFGAQTKHADAPFWEAAFALADGAIYAFASAASRTFIERRAVARAARIEVTRPVRWELARTFPHHRKRRAEIPVDLWVLRRGQDR